MTQHVDEVLFVGDVRKEDIIRHRQLHISCEGDLDSDVAACELLMCCVLGGWNAVTIEYYDGEPNLSRHIVTVESAYLWICWEPMRPCYTMEQCPTVQHMLNLVSWSGNAWWQTGPDSVRQNGFLWCSRHEFVVKEGRWVATQLETMRRWNRSSGSTCIGCQSTRTEDVTWSLRLNVYCATGMPVIESIIFCPISFARHTSTSPVA